MRMRPRRHTFFLVTLAALLVLVTLLAGCSNNSNEVANTPTSTITQTSQTSQTSAAPAVNEFEIVREAAEAYVTFDIAIAQGKFSETTAVVEKLTGQKPTSVADFLAAHRAALG